MTITNGFYARLAKLEQAPVLSADIPPGSILLPLQPLSASEQEYVRTIPAGVREYRPGYMLINLVELSWEDLDVLHAIVLGEFADWIPLEELVRRFISIDEDSVPKDFADAPIVTDRRGIKYHLQRVEYRWLRGSVIRGNRIERERLQMWCDAFAGDYKL